MNEARELLEENLEYKRIFSGRTSSLSSSRRLGSSTGLSGTSDAGVGGKDSGRKTLSPGFLGGLR